MQGHREKACSLMSLGFNLFGASPCQAHVNPERWRKLEPEALGMSKYQPYVTRSHGHPDPNNSLLVRADVVAAART